MLSDHLHMQIERLQLNKRNHTVLFETLLSEIGLTENMLDKLYTSSNTHQILINRKEINKHLNNIDSILFILQHGGVYKQDFKQTSFTFSSQLEITPLNNILFRKKEEPLLSLGTKLRKLTSSYSHTDPQSSTIELVKLKRQSFEKAHFHVEQLIQVYFSVLENNLKSRHKQALFMQIAKYGTISLLIITFILAIYKRSPRKNTKSENPESFTLSDIQYILNKIPTSIIVHNQNNSIFITNDHFHEEFNRTNTINITKLLCTKKVCRPEMCPFYTKSPSAHCTVEYNGKTYNKHMQQVKIGAEQILVETYFLSEAPQSKNSEGYADINTINDISFRIAKSLPNIDSEACKSLLQIIIQKVKPDSAYIFKTEKSTKGYNAYIVCNAFKNENLHRQNIFRKLPNRSRLPNHIWEDIHNKQQVELSEQQSEILQALEIKHAVLFPVFNGKEAWGGIGIEFHEQSFENQTDAHITTLIAKNLSRIFYFALRNNEAKFQLNEAVHTNYIQQENDFLKKELGLCLEQKNIYKEMLKPLSDEISTIYAKLKLLSPDHHNQERHKLLLKEIAVLSNTENRFKTGKTNIKAYINQTNTRLKKTLPNIMIELLQSSPDSTEISISEEMLGHIIFGMSKALADNHNSHLILISFTANESDVMICFDEKHTDSHIELATLDFTRVNKKADLSKSSGLTLLCISEIVKQQRGTINCSKITANNYKYKISIPHSDAGLKKTEPHIVYITEKEKSIFMSNTLANTPLKTITDWRTAHSEINSNPPRMLIIDPLSSKAANSKIAQFINKSPKTKSIAISGSNELSEMCDFQISEEELIVHMNSILKLANSYKNPDKKGNILIIENDNRIIDQITNAFTKYFSIFSDSSITDIKFETDLLQPNIIIANIDILNAKQNLIPANIFKGRNLYAYGKQKTTKTPLFNTAYFIASPVDWELLAENINNIN